MSAAPEMGQGQGTLSAAAVLVADARQDLDRLDAELTSHLAAATATWGGQGGLAFQALGVAWSDKQRAIVGALEGFEESLLSTERENVRTDEEQTAAFVRTERRLG